MPITDVLKGSINSAGNAEPLASVKNSLVLSILAVFTKVLEALLFNDTPKPLVVQAGVPNLIPDVIIGLSVSKGIPFLLQVIFALPNDA